MPTKHVTRLLTDAVNKEQENKMWDAWLSLYPYMAMQWLNFKPFSEFKDELLSAQFRTSDKSLEEIEEEMDRVIAAYEGR